MFHEAQTKRAAMFAAAPLSEYLPIVCDTPELVLLVDALFPHRTQADRQRTDAPSITLREVGSRRPLAQGVIYEIFYEGECERQPGDNPRLKPHVYATSQDIADLWREINARVRAAEQLLSAPAAEPVPTSNDLAIRSGLVCSLCGSSANDPATLGEWRFTGDPKTFGWAHKCPGSHPQAGHIGEAVVGASDDAKKSNSPG